ncbi:MAG TPA: AAA family ATPase [Rhabdochlamydiaceae bacterium]|nr:AAA family ATPase [Rhabdochlamydiaceae bacterium]
MKRVYEILLEKHLAQYRQMAFISGPRQVGKTTTSLEASSENPLHYYFNWDNEDHRELIIEGPQAIARATKLDQLQKQIPVLVFDEIHKYRNWKRFLKGFFDTYEKQCRILVTGSSRLDVYKRGGDSLMGRYFLYRLHPLSIREIADPSLPDKDIQQPRKIKPEDYQALLTYGGFPEPYLKRSKSFFNHWKRLRIEQLFREDIRDLSRIQEIGQIQLLAEILQEEASHALNHSMLASKVKVSSPTLQRWIELLKNFYFCFTIQPWSKNLSRSLVKEPKIYLWNWATIEDTGARLENLVASHLYKAVQFWTDCGFGDYGLYYLRDKEKREVDFLVTKNRKPWFLVEAKTNGTNNGISRWLYYFQEKLKAPHAFQIGFDLPYIDKDCFEIKTPIIVPATTFLSQLI